MARLDSLSAQLDTRNPHRSGEVFARAIGVYSWWRLTPTGVGSTTVTTSCQCPTHYHSTDPPMWAPYKKFSEGSTMSEDIKAQVRAIAHEIARREVFEHEIRFTLSGALLGAVAVLAWLVATGRF